MNELMNFDRFLTPIFIKIIFWIGVLYSLLYGLITIISSFSDYGSGSSVLIGLLYIVVGPFVSRVYCELILVAFKIQQHLQSIDKKMTERL